jgi:DNA repair ATPase RecN
MAKSPSNERLGKARVQSRSTGSALALSDLNKIAKYLADIHNQFDFEKILNPENYLEIIDGFSYELTAAYKKEYHDLLEVYRARKSEYDALLEKEEKVG